MGAGGGGHPRGRQRVAGAGTLTRGGGRGDGLRRLGFVDFRRLRRRRGAGAPQVSTVDIVSQRSTKALNTRQVFFSFASCFLFKLIGCHPLFIDQDTLSLGSGLVFGDIEQSRH